MHSRILRVQCYSLHIDFRDRHAEYRWVWSTHTRCGGVSIIYAHAEKPQGCWEFIGFSDTCTSPHMPSSRAPFKWRESTRGIPTAGGTVAFSAPQTMQTSLVCFGTLEAQYVDVLHAKTCVRDYMMGNLQLSRIILDIVNFVE